MLNELWDKKWSDVMNEGIGRLDSSDMGEDNPGFYMELPESSEDRDAVVGYTEYLEWHLEHKNIPEEYLTSRYEEDDEESWLTQEGLDRVGDVIGYELMRHGDELMRHLGSDYDARSLWVSDSLGGDDSHFTAELILPKDLPGTFGEVYEKYVSPFVAVLINTTDPGTFNCIYLFSEV